MKTKMSASLVIINGTVIDGTGVDPIREGIVLIGENRILAVDRADNLAVMPGAQVIDASGRTVLPGLIDSHTHDTADPTVRRQFLKAGITSVCDLGSPLSSMPLFTEANAEDGPAARGYKAGPIMIDNRPFPEGMEIDPGTFCQVATVAEARAAAADLLERGVDVTKVLLDSGWPRGAVEPLNTDQVREVVSEAHALGVLTRAHCNDVKIWHIAVDGGVDAIEHIPMPSSFNKLWNISTSNDVDVTGLTRLLSDIFSPAEQRAIEESTDSVPDLLSIPVPEYDTLLPRMVQEHIAMVPTLERGPVGDLSKLPNLLPIQRGVIQALLDIVGRFHTAGGMVVLGTDYCGGFNGPEMVMSEIRFLLAAGLSPMEVIKAGTQHAAYVSGQRDELGTLEPDKFADVIIVDGDPLTDIEVLGRVVTVINDGKISYSHE